jgi:cytochrome c oxidase assembly protein subunit 15
MVISVKWAAAAFHGWYMSSFTRYAWGVLGWNLAVVAWGSYVRATGSGAGCGAHWPLCNGEVIPRAAAVSTAIEFTHRASSGAGLFLVVTLVIWASLRFPRHHAALKAAVAAGVLLVTEALVGASLVLFGWVGQSTAPARGWVMALHLVTTFLLLGAVTLCAALGDGPGKLELRGRGVLNPVMAVALGATLVAGLTGAIAALGDTLYPARSLLDGLRQELGPGTHTLLRLRLLHPFAAAGAAIAILAAARLVLKARLEEPARGRAMAVIALIGVELVLGPINVALLAPVWLQIVHLAVADLTWVTLVLLAASILSPARAEAWRVASRLSRPRGANQVVPPQLAMSSARRHANLDSVDMAATAALNPVPVRRGNARPTGVK